MTNSAVSNWWTTADLNGATKCYLAVEDGKWVKGCAYDEVDLYTKSIIDEMLGKPIAPDKKSFVDFSERDKE